mgnify:CR=1 FL=1
MSKSWVLDVKESEDGELYIEMTDEILSWYNTTREEVRMIYHQRIMSRANY